MKARHCTFPFSLSRVSRRDSIIGEKERKREKEGSLDVTCKRRFDRKISLSIREREGEVSEERETRGARLPITGAGVPAAALALFPPLMPLPTYTCTCLSLSPLQSE